MKKPDNIYVALQLRKDQNSGNLLLDIHFNKEAPNFSHDQESISWSPTLEELDFIAEVFDLVAKNKRGEAKAHLLDEPPATRQIDESQLLDRVMDKKDRRSITADR